MSRFTKETEKLSRQSDIPATRDVQTHLLLPWKNGFNGVNVKWYKEARDRHPDKKPRDGEIATKPPQADLPPVRDWLPKKN